VGAVYPGSTGLTTGDAGGPFTVTTAYDALYRPLGIETPSGNAHYTYNAAGQRTHLVYPSGEVVTYTHDAAGRLRTVTDWDGGVTVYTYTAAGRLASLTLPNGVETAYSYDAAGRLVEIAHRDATGVLLARYTYTLDAVGNRTEVTEGVGATGEAQAGSPAPGAPGSSTI